jgi:hypothetical protein
MTRKVSAKGLGFGNDTHGQEGSLLGELGDLRVCLLTLLGWDDSISDILELGENGRSSIFGGLDDHLVLLFEDW